MNDRQMEARTKSLQSALGRMSEAREARTGDVAVIDFGAAAARDTAAGTGRRRFFRFGERAQAAVSDDE